MGCFRPWKRTCKSHVLKQTKSMPFVWPFFPQIFFWNAALGAHLPPLVLSSFSVENKDKSKREKRHLLRQTKGGKCGDRGVFAAACSFLPSQEKLDGKSCTSPASASSSSTTTTTKQLRVPCALLPLLSLFYLPLDHIVVFRRGSGLRVCCQCHWKEGGRKGA